MGLTKEQLRDKAIKDMTDYVIKNGKKISDDLIYWGTYPVVIKDICVTGVAVAGKSKKVLSFGDMKNNIFAERKAIDDVNKKFIEETLADMKSADKRYQK